MTRWVQENLGGPKTSFPQLALRPASTRKILRFICPFASLAPKGDVFDLVCLLVAWVS